MRREGRWSDHETAYVVEKAGGAGCSKVLEVGVRLPQQLDGLLAMLCCLLF